ncbi:hypothetical protein BTI71_08555 [Lactobacillus delbrueckii subsp. bulgaricus]|nr:hypothetical protein [Lactobacillus delbrueckii subsp. bulgaricus]
MDKMTVKFRHARDNYDKILDLGHLTLIRNNKYMNSLWRNKIAGAWTYEDAFKSNLTYHFDEGGGMAVIAKKSGCKIYSEAPGRMNFTDISPFKSRFEIAYGNADDRLPHIFAWKNVVLTGYYIKDSKIKSKDYAYVHLQKREIQILGDNLDGGFMIVPNKFLPFDKSMITSEFIRSQYDDAIGERKRKNIIQRVIGHIKFQKFRLDARKRHIPLNSNEAYFGIEEVKY